MKMLRNLGTKKYLTILLSLGLVACNGVENTSDSAGSISSNLQSKNEASLASTHIEQTEYAYAAGSSNGTAVINEYEVDVDTGELSKLANTIEIAGYNYIDSIVVMPNNKFAYATAYRTSDHHSVIQAFTINSDGSLTKGKLIASSNYYHSIGITPNNKYLYLVTNNSVEEYNIDPNTGNLTTLGNPFWVSIEGPHDIVISPSGKYAFVNCHYETAGPSDPTIQHYNVTSFTVDQQTGFLYKQTQHNEEHQVKSIAAGSYSNIEELFSVMNPEVNTYLVGSSGKLPSSASSSSGLSGDSIGNNVIKSGGNSYMFVASKAGAIYTSTLQEHYVPLYQKPSNNSVRIAETIDYYYWGSFTTAAVIPDFHSASNDPLDVSIDKTGQYFYVTAPSIGIYNYKLNGNSLTPLSQSSLSEPSLTKGNMAFATIETEVPDPSPTVSPEPESIAGRPLLAYPPVQGRTNVSANTTFLVRFPLDIDKSSVNTNTLHITETKGTSQANDAKAMSSDVIEKAYNIFWLRNPGGRKFEEAEITPTSPFTKGAKVTVSIYGETRAHGTEGLKSLNSNMRIEPTQVYDVVEPSNLDSVRVESMNLVLRFPDTLVDQEKNLTNAITVEEEDTGKVVATRTGVGMSMTKTKVLEPLKPDTAYTATGNIYLTDGRVVPVSVLFVTTSSEPEVVMIEPNPTTDVPPNTNFTFYVNTKDPIVSESLVLTDSEGNNIPVEQQYGRSFYRHFTSFYLLGGLKAGSDVFGDYSARTRSGSMISSRTRIQVAESREYPEDKLVIYEAANNGVGYTGAFHHYFEETDSFDGIRDADEICNSDPNKPDDQDPPLPNGEIRPKRIYKAIILYSGEANAVNGSFVYKEARYPCEIENGTVQCGLAHAANWVLYRDTDYYRVNNHQYELIGTTNYDEFFSRDTPLANPIRTGSYLNLYAWTGITLPTDETKDGWYARPSSAQWIKNEHILQDIDYQCSGWTIDSTFRSGITEYLFYGGTGIPGSKNINSVFNRGPDECTIKHSLYCAQQGYQTTP